MAATNALRTEGTRNLIAAARQLGARRFLTQSMVFGYGYGDWGGQVLTEADRSGRPAAAGSRSTWPRCGRTRDRL